MGKRYSFFYILGCVASAFSGILAYGIMQLKGQAGLSGWRWIFVSDRPGKFQNLVLTAFLDL
jgi:hypothetical protein